MGINKSGSIRLEQVRILHKKGDSPGVEFPRIQGIERVATIADDPSDTYPLGQQVAAIMGGMGRFLMGTMQKIPLFRWRSFFLLKETFPGKHWLPFRKCFKHSRAL